MRRVKEKEKKEFDGWYKNNTRHFYAGVRRPSPAECAEWGLEQRRRRRMKTVTETELLPLLEKIDKLEFEQESLKGIVREKVKNIPERKTIKANAVLLKEWWKEVRRLGREARQGVFDMGAEEKG